MAGCHTLTHPTVGVGECVAPQQTGYLSKVTLPSPYSNWDRLQQLIDPEREWVLKMDGGRVGRVGWVDQQLDGSICTRNCLKRENLSSFLFLFQGVKKKSPLQTLDNETLDMKELTQINWVTTADLTLWCFYILCTKMCMLCCLWKPTPLRLKMTKLRRTFWKHWCCLGFDMQRSQNMQPRQWKSAASTAGAINLHPCA